MIEIPVSYGELVDKVSILHVKYSMMKDLDKIANVMKELDLLIEKMDQIVKRDLLSEDDLYDKLFIINTHLWQVEDELRLLEKEKNFGKRFIKLAREVYKTNDQRAAIKRQINELLGSELIEEKEYIKY